MTTLATEVQMGARLYLADELDAIPWPATEDGDYARRYVTPLMRDGVTAHITNVETRVAVMCVDDLALPVTINDAEWANCYVCAPYNHYVDYAAEELKTLGAPRTEAVLRGALKGLGLALRAGRINRVVHVNNWLLSTNLYPALSAEQIRVVTEALVARFPDHAIVWRSVNTVEGKGLWDQFSGAGYRPVASRQLYYQYPADDGFYNANDRKIWKKDVKLLQGSPYQLLRHEDLVSADLPRVLELYDQLYLEKYSRHNPQFTVRYLETALADGTLELRALRHRETGVIDGAVGFFLRNGALTTPLFGYDIHLPQAVGLYRMLSAVMYLEAQGRGLLLNMSSGAANFKRSRGGRGNIEASMVYDRHLPLYRRATWALLAASINGVAVPLMKRYKV